MATRIQWRQKRLWRIWIPLCSVLFLCLLEFGCSRGPRSMISRLWKSEPTDAQRYSESTKRQEQRDRAQYASTMRRRSNPGLATTSDKYEGRATTASARRSKPDRAFVNRTAPVSQSRRNVDPKADPFLAASRTEPDDNAVATRHIRSLTKPETTVPESPRAETPFARTGENPFAAINRASRNTPPATREPVQEPVENRNETRRPVETKRQPPSDGKIATVPSLDDVEDRARLSGGYEEEMRRLRKSIADSKFNAMPATHERVRRDKIGAPDTGSTTGRGVSAARFPKQNRSSMPIVSQRKSKFEFESNTGTEKTVGTSSTIRPTSKFPPAENRNPFLQASRRSFAAETPGKAGTPAAPVGFSSRRSETLRKVTPGDRSMIIDSSLVPDRIEGETVPSDAFEQFVEPPTPRELQIIPRTRVRSSSMSTPTVSPGVQQASAERVSAMEGRAFSASGGWSEKQPTQHQTPIDTAAVETVAAEKRAPLPPAEMPIPDSVSAIGKSAEIVTDSDPTLAEAPPVAERDEASETPEKQVGNSPKPATVSSQVVLLGILFAITMVCYFFRRRRGTSRLL